MDNIGITAGSGVYGGGVSFGRMQSGGARAGIAGVQTTSDQDQMGIAFFTHPSTSVSANLVEAIRIDHSGKVGIGTTLPSETLHVDGTVMLENLPTSDPSNTGELWNDSGTLKISA
jgi:hypothetical protein